MQNRLPASGQRNAQGLCRLHTITASNGEGMPGGERIQATMVFEKII